MFSRETGVWVRVPLGALNNMGRWPSGLGAGLQNQFTGVRILHGLLNYFNMLILAWIGGVLLGLMIVGAVVSIVNGDYDSMDSVDEADDWEARLTALMIINDLKYTRPEVWAKCASDIMGKCVAPPTPEQCEEYFRVHPEKRKS